MIGIVGFGFVGQAVYAALMNPSEAVVIYDKFKAPHQHNAKALLKTDAVFICVSTPTVGCRHQDASAVIKTLTWLRKSNYKGLALIKSTVLYELVKPHLDSLRVVFNPEFLSQNHAVADFLQRPVVLGGEMTECVAARDVYEAFFDEDMGEPQYIYCTAEQACQLKYVHNIYHAYKALFWNYVYEVTGNHRKLYELYTQVRPDRIEMQQVAADGKLGIGGACFPKDITAFNHEHPHELTEFMLNYNGRLRPDALELKTQG